MQKHLFEEECALACAPRVVPFGPVMVAPVIMAFGTPEQQQRFLPGIASGEVWWSQGYSEPGSGSDLASLKCKAERQGDHYLVNGQKTWTTLGQYGDWIFCLVRTSSEGKPQTGISFLLIDMKSPGISVRPIMLMDGEHEVNEVWFDNVKVPAENLIGEENKGWTYAKHLLAHERTNIADVNRAKRELERLKRIAKAEGVWDDLRFRDQIALLEVDIVALEMLVLRVLSAEKNGKQSLDIAGLLKIRGSEIQQRYAELMMLAAGPLARALHLRGHGSRLAGRPGRARHAAAAGRHLLQHAQDHHLRRQQRGPAQHRRADRAGLTRGQETPTWTSTSPTTRTACATPCAAGSTRASASSAATPWPRPAAPRAPSTPNWPSWAWPGWPCPRPTAAWASAPWKAMVVCEELGRGLVNAPYAEAALMAPGCWRRRAGRRAGRLAARAWPMAKRWWCWRCRSAPARYRLQRVGTTPTPTPKAGDGWMLTGAKCVVPAGDEADAFIVPARLHGRRATQPASACSWSSAARPSPRPTPRRTAPRRRADAGPPRRSRSAA
jgi:alkylation response protein AidB-like acyl-CoA dehydrogenase